MARPSFPKIGSLRTGDLVPDPKPLVDGATDEQRMAFEAAQEQAKKHAGIRLTVKLARRDVVQDWAFRAQHIARRALAAGDDFDKAAPLMPESRALARELLTACLVKLEGFDIDGQPIEDVSDPAALVDALEGADLLLQAGYRARALQSLTPDQQLF